MRYYTWITLAVCVIGLLAAGHTAFAEDDDEQYKLVTCGSTMKLEHVNSKFLLHSHPINWGSGSGQQSVTASKVAADTNDLWSVREGFGQPACMYGDVIRCGAIVRIMHSNTQKFLHSHNHRSPLSGRQEVSAFEVPNSNADDNWEVVCVRRNAANWERAAPVSFRHVSTGMTLFARRADAFTQQNCRNCPIVGQLEVSASSQTDDNTHWVTEDGVFFPTRDPEDDAEYDNPSAAGDSDATVTAGRNLKEEL